MNYTVCRNKFSFQTDARRDKVTKCGRVEYIFVFTHEWN